MNVPDYFEPIIGWREWSVSQGAQPYLMATSHTVVWPKYEAMVAECVGGRDACEAPCAPNDHDKEPGAFDCGIYAHKEKQADFCSLRSLTWGKVYLWGRVWEHDGGYRAQYAYPCALSDGAVAREYGVRTLTEAERELPEPEKLAAADLGWAWATIKANMVPMLISSPLWKTIYLDTDLAGADFDAPSSPLMQPDEAVAYYRNFLAPQDPLTKPHRLLRVASATEAEIRRLALGKRPTKDTS